MRNAPVKRARRRKSARTPDYQLPLPLFEHGLQATHQYPLVGDLDKHVQGRRPAAQAWRDWHYIEANPPHAYTALLFDIDDPDRWEYEVVGPTPNWQIRKNSRPATYHVVYTLETPVARHDASREAPLKLYRRVHDALAFQFGADRRYNGLLTKNPLHPPPGCTTQFLRTSPFTLGELSEWIQTDIPPHIPTTCVGRNEDLFHECVKLAHQPRWARIIKAEGYATQWLQHVRLLNVASFAENPLPDSECRSIAKSCAKYSRSQFSEETFSQIQSARGTKRARKRWTHPTPAWFDPKTRRQIINDMLDLGHTRQGTADFFNVSKRTIQREIAEMQDPDAHLS